MDKEIASALWDFTATANNLLANSVVAAYGFGSAVYDDFHIGYSDLDFFLIVDKSLTDQDFEALHQLRDRYKEEGDPYLSVLEGEFITRAAIRNDHDSNVIYWGTSKDCLNKRYGLSGFSMRGLLENGQLIYGQDLREDLPYPSDDDMCRQVESMVQTIRQYAAITSGSVHSADWFFLITQSIYWLKTRRVTSKTKSAEWVLENCNYAWNDKLKKAIGIRMCPEKAKNEAVQAWLADLGDDIQQACDSMQHELEVLAS